jgi:cytochrome bd-type quinol oxidase subunit 2
MITIIGIGVLAVILFGVGLYLHDFHSNLKISRVWEIVFLCTALASAMLFLLLFGKELLRGVELILQKYLAETTMKS